MSLSKRLECWTALLAGVLLALVALHSFATQVTSGDNAWLLLAAKRMLAGEQLYSDIMETNPPLIVWLYAVPVWLSEQWGLIYTALFRWCVLLLVAMSMALAWRQMRDVVPPRIANALLIAGMFVLLCAPATLLGQREYVWMILITPYLLGSLGGRLPGAGSTALAAIGFCIKPYFLLLWVANEVVMAFYARQPRQLFRLANWLFGAMCLCYLASILLLTPNYIPNIVTPLRIVYETYSMDRWTIVKELLTLGVYFCLPCFAPKTNPAYQRAAWQLMVAYIAASIIAIIQQKGWLNHYFPMYYLGALLAVLNLAGYGRGARLWQKVWLCITVMFAVAPFGPYLKLTFSAAKPDVVRERIEVNIGRYAKDQAVMAFTYNLQPTMPAVMRTNATMPMRLMPLWMMPPALLERKSGDEWSRLYGMQMQVGRLVCEDLMRFQPALVWVDENSHAAEPVKDLDFIGVMSQNPCFVEAWKRYRKIDTVSSEGPAPVMRYSFYVRQK